MATPQVLSTLIQPISNDDTTLGRVGKTGLWSGATVIILAITTTIIGQPQLFSWHSGILVTIASVVFVFLKNLRDSNVPNS